MQNYEKIETGIDETISMLEEQYGVPMEVIEDQIIPMCKKLASQTLYEILNDFTEFMRQRGLLE